jgi:hypothetical protein
MRPEAIRVIVPRYEVECVGKVVVIDTLVTKAHEVVRDEVIGALYPEDIYLKLLVSNVGIGGKAGKIQGQAGVG